MISERLEQLDVCCERKRRKKQKAKGREKTEAREEKKKGWEPHAFIEKRRPCVTSSIQHSRVSSSVPNLCSPPLPKLFPCHLFLFSTQRGTLSRSPVPHRAKPKHGAMHRRAGLLGQPGGRDAEEEKKKRPGAGGC